MSTEDDSQLTLKSEFDRIKFKIKSSKVNHFATIPDLKEIKSSSCGSYLLALSTQNKIIIFSLQSNSKLQEMSPDMQITSFYEKAGCLYIYGKGLKKCENYLQNPNFQTLSTEDITCMAITEQNIYYISKRTLRKLDGYHETNTTATVLAANGQIVVAAQKSIAIIYNHELHALSTIKLKEDYKKLVLLESDLLIAGSKKKSIQIYDYGKKNMYNYKMLNKKNIESFDVSEEMNMLVCIDIDVSFFNIESYKDEAKLKLGDEKKNNLNKDKSICFAHQGKSVFFSMGSMIYQFDIVEYYMFSEIVDFNSDIEQISYNGKVVIKANETMLFDLITRDKEIQGSGDFVKTTEGVFSYIDNKVFKNGVELSLMASESPIVKIFSIKDYIVTQSQDNTIKILIDNNTCRTFLRSDPSEFLGQAGGYYFIKSLVSNEPPAEALSHRHRVASIDDKQGSFFSSFKEDSDIKALSTKEFSNSTKQIVESWPVSELLNMTSKREISGNLILFNNSPQIASFKDWVLSIYDSVESNNRIRISCNELIGEPIYMSISSDDMYFYVATNAYLGIYSIFEYKFLGSIYYGTIDRILVLDRSILITRKNVLHIYPNPLERNAEFSLLTSESFTLKHWNDLYTIVESPNSGKYNSYLNQVTMLPICSNLLHYFTHNSSHEGIKKALKEGCPYLKSRRMSPLQIIFLQKTNNLLEYFLKSIPRYLETDENVLYRIEDDLILLNKFSFTKLLNLYNSILVDPQQRLPKFGTPLFQGIKTELTSSQVIDPSLYIKQRNESDKNVSFSQSLPLSFKVSAMRLPLKFGTQESLDFLDSLRNIQEQDLLLTPIIQSILTCKWNKVWYWTLMQCILVLNILLVLNLYIFFFEHSHFLFACIQILNLLNLVLECLQMSVGFRKYILNFLNIMDLLRICCILLLCLNLERKYERLLLTYIVMFTWIKPISYLRIFDKTRYFIYILSCCAKDIVPFLVILFYLNFTFALSFYSFDQIKANPDFSGFTEAWVHSYSLNFNSFNISVYKDYKEWIVFLIATVTNPLILMNMIIALLGNTYTMVKDQAGTADMKELAGMIIEFESMLFWRRRTESKMFVQICSLVKMDADEPDTVKSQVKNIYACVSQAKEGLESFSIHSQETLQTIDVILSKVSSEFSIELEKLESNLRSDYQLLLKRII